MKTASNDHPLIATVVSKSPTNPATQTIKIIAHDVAENFKRLINKITAQEFRSATSPETVSDHAETKQPV